MPAFETEWLLSRLAELLPGFPVVRVLVALSGGVDSTALLAALADARRTARAEGFRVRAVHVNHGLHPNAPKWSKQCRALARRLGIPLQVVSVKVDRSGGASLEAAAREARYGVLADRLEPGEFLLTAHHEDDQLETVLLQLFRGAGVAGLAAMPEIAPFGRGWHARPLLSRTRDELVEWVKSAGLSWIEDDTNTDESLDRNYLRRQVLPLIRERWPGAAKAVARSARHAAEAQRLLDEVARADVGRAACGRDLFVSRLRVLPRDRRRNALRFWIARAGVRLPDTSRLEELAGPVIEARMDANPRLAWADVEVQRHADLLSIAKYATDATRSAHVTRAPHVTHAAHATHPADARAADAARASDTHAADTPRDDVGSPAIDWPWLDTPVLRLPQDGGTLELKPDPHGPIDLDRLPMQVTVRQRTGGERLRPRRGGPRRSLKSLLQEARVPIRTRARLPLLFAGATLLAVGTLWVDESVQTTPTTARRARLVLTRDGDSDGRRRS
jgi:tRNA(Ile)-lysidine synthase